MSQCCKLGHIAGMCQSNKAPVVLKPPRSNQWSACMVEEEGPCFVTGTSFEGFRFRTTTMGIWSTFLFTIQSKARKLMKFTLKVNDIKWHGFSHWWSCVNNPFRLPKYMHRELKVMHCKLWQATQTADLVCGGRRWTLSAKEGLVATNYVRLEGYLLS